MTAGYMDAPQNDAEDFETGFALATEISSPRSWPIGEPWRTIGEPLANHWRTIGEPLADHQNSLSHGLDEAQGNSGI